eukprot:6091436-Pyramimonas_sp.AAC.1
MRKRAKPKVTRRRMGPVAWGPFSAIGAVNSPRKRAITTTEKLKRPILRSSGKTQPFLRNETTTPNNRVLTNAVKGLLAKLIALGS